MSVWRYTCPGSERTLPITAQEWRCPDGTTPFELDGPNDLRALTLDPADQTMARYREILPVESESLITLGAGMTPLVPGELAGRQVRFKLDSLLPTGSFKDRGAAVVVAHLRRLGVRKVVVDSSGNAAAAMAAYSAAARLACVVYAPEATSPGKLVQSRAYGAEVVLVGGTRDDVAAAAQDAAESDPDAYYSSHNWSPIFAEGVKTWALEVWEQLGGRSPAVAFIPVGGGSALMGAERGFAATGQMPKLVAAQPSACAPIADAFQRGADDVEPTTPAQTLAEGAKIGQPARGRMALQALRTSGGWATAITEDSLTTALRSMWSRGIYAEPTAALGAAAFVDAVERGQDVPAGDVVILVTGSGLKATEVVAGLV
jgi:threonine synthase